MVIAAISTTDVSQTDLGLWFMNILSRNVNTIIRAKNMRGHGCAL